MESEIARDVNVKPTVLKEVDRVLENWKRDLPGDAEVAVEVKPLSRRLRELDLQLRVATDSGYFFGKATSHNILNALKKAKKKVTRQIRRAHERREPKGNGRWLLKGVCHE